MFGANVTSVTSSSVSMITTRGNPCLWQSCGYINVNHPLIEEVVDVHSRTSKTTHCARYNDESKATDALETTPIQSTGAITVSTFQQGLRVFTRAGPQVPGS
jgi:hypothetical protein